MKLYGGIEAGGTKFVCTVAIGPTDDPVSALTVVTTTPGETLGRVISFFKKYDLKALGIASFGPIDLSRESPTYGYITGTPKPGWKQTDIAQLFRLTFDVPTGFDTDVNAAVLAEARYGAARGLSHAIYVTVGTGIGAGAVINGEVLHGLVHPEMGHLPVPRHPRDTYAGHCVFHRDCLEGMASGPAIEDRWKMQASTLPPDHEAWEFEAYYLARAICAMVYTISPQRIICGGGVMHHRQQRLFPLIRGRVAEMLNGYIRSESIIDRIGTFILPPGLGNRSGTVGALELAQRAEAEER
jgi:fructokinase